MPYIPNTDDDRRKMLDKIGVKNFEELIENIPENLRLKGELNIPALSEMELLSEIEVLSRQNGPDQVCFAGGGVYDHYIPSVVGAVTSRPEFTGYLRIPDPYLPADRHGCRQRVDVRRSDSRRRGGGAGHACQKKEKSRSLRNRQPPLP